LLCAIIAKAGTTKGVCMVQVMGFKAIELVSGVNEKTRIPIFLKDDRLYYIDENGMLKVIEGSVKIVRE
jgi:hypothetical protein